MHKNFAFGSNLLTARIETRLGVCPVLGIAELRGYDLRFHKKGVDGSAKADALKTESKNHSVFGAVYELNDEQKHALDAIEGVGKGYRIQTETVGLNGITTEVYLYVAEPPYAEPDYLPYCWYKNFVLHGAVEHGFPQLYVDSIRVVQELEDDNEHRRNENRRILGRCF